MESKNSQRNLTATVELWRFLRVEPEALDYIDGDQTYWEHEPLRNLASQGQLQAFVHKGFWKPMDTLRDRTSLNEMWASGNAPWKSW